MYIWFKFWILSTGLVSWAALFSHALGQSHHHIGPSTFSISRYYFSWPLCKIKIKFHFALWCGSLHSTTPILAWRATCARCCSRLSLMCRTCRQIEIHLSSDRGSTPCPGICSKITFSKAKLKFEAYDWCCTTIFEAAWKLTSTTADRQRRCDSSSQEMLSADAFGKRHAVLWWYQNTCIGFESASASSLACHCCSAKD